MAKTQLKMENVPRAEALIEVGKISAEIKWVVALAEELPSRPKSRNVACKVEFLKLPQSLI
jgi:hypothetical protein